MSLLDHPEWPALREHSVVKDVVGDPWGRLEVIRPVDSLLEMRFLMIRVPCPHCEVLYQPVRARRTAADDRHLRPHPTGGMYIASSCQSGTCEKTKAARAEKILIRSAILAWQLWRCA